MSGRWQEPVEPPQVSGCSLVLLQPFHLTGASWDCNPQAENAPFGCGVPSRRSHPSPPKVPQGCRDCCLSVAISFAKLL